MDDSASRPPPADPATADVDRLEALEQQVRQLTSRLAGWVEAQLVQAMDDRRNDLKALRAELQAVVDQQLAGVRAETASVLSVATHRLDVGQEQLSERLETVGQRAAEAAAAAAASAASGTTDPARIDAMEQRVASRLDALRAEVEASLHDRLQATTAPGPAADGLEQRVRQAMSRLTESVEAQLAELAAARAADIDGLRRELSAALDDRVGAVASRSGAGLAAVQDGLGQQLAALTERVDDVARQAISAADGLGAATAEATAASARADAFEQRVKSAMGRLTDSVETRMAEATTTHHDEVERFRTELGRQADAAAADSVRARETAAEALVQARAGADRTQTLEQQVKAAVTRLNTTVDAKAAELTGAMTEAGEKLRAEARAEVAKELREARAELGSAIDAANKRTARFEATFDERLGSLTRQAASLTGSLEILDSTVASDGTRLEALELHTRRTDAKLTELVEERFAVLAAGRDTELEQFRAELTAAMGASGAAARAELGSMLDAARTELAAAAGDLRAQGDELQAAIASQLAAARSELAAALEAARAELAAGAEALDETRAGVAAQLAEAAAALEAQAEMAATVASLGRKADRAQERARKLSDRVEELAAAVAKAGSMESGALAPLRSDLVALRAQVDGLAEAVAEGPARRRAAPPAPAPPAKITAAEKALAVAARKAIAPPRSSSRRRSQ